jgi:hypothetical protein
MRSDCIKLAYDVSNFIFINFYIEQIALKKTNQSRNVWLRQLTSYFTNNKRCSNGVKVLFIY